MTAVAAVALSVSDFRERESTKVETDNGTARDFHRSTTPRPGAADHPTGTQARRGERAAVPPST